jgi:nucleoside-diphosphate-sugar epimerase
MKILVTGGTGFIGSYFIPMLLKSGYEVRLLVRDIEKAKRLFGEKCEYHVGDVTDRQSIEGCCEGVDIVFHLVAKSGNELPSKENFEEFRRINVAGTENILAECGNIKKFIYVSSTAAMGLVKDNPITERSKCEPYLPYQVTKFEVEELIRSKCKEGLPGIIVRPTKVYGVNEQNYSYLKLAKLVKKGVFFKIGNGHNYTSNVYVSDFAEVLTKLVKGGVIGETYIISSEDSVDFIESGEIMADVLGVKLKVVKAPDWLFVFVATIEERLFILLGKTPIVTRRNIEMTIQDRIYDISKAKKEIGYEPKVSMRQGIRAVVEWYVREGLL